MNEWPQVKVQLHSCVLNYVGLWIISSYIEVIMELDRKTYLGRMSGFPVTKLLPQALHQSESIGLKSIVSWFIAFQSVT